MTTEVYVVNKPSKALVDLVSRLRERKKKQLEDMRKNKDVYLRVDVVK